MWVMAASFRKIIIKWFISRVLHHLQNPSWPIRPTHTTCGWVCNTAKCNNYYILLQYYILLCNKVQKNVTILIINYDILLTNGWSTKKLFVKFVITFCTSSICEQNVTIIPMDDVQNVISALVITFSSSITFFCLITFCCVTWCQVQFIWVISLWCETAAEQWGNCLLPLWKF